MELAALKPPPVLTQPEVSSLLAQPSTSSLTGLRNRCMMEVMYRCGLRVSEVVALTRNDYRGSGDRAWFEVRDSKYGGSRNVPIPTGVIALLESYLAIVHPTAWGDEILFCQLWDRHGLCESRAGSKLSTRYVQQMVSRLGVKAGITRPVTPHMLRHTGATKLLKHSTFRETQVWLGHARPETTMRYTHVDDDELAAAAEEAFG